MPRPSFDLYLITDPAMPGGLVGSVETALSQGVPKGRVAVQLRAKSLSLDELLEAGRKLRSITQRAGASLLVNGPWHVAEAIDADGIQVPEGGADVIVLRNEIGSHALVGRSCHDLAGVMACAAIVDFVTLSPYFTVQGKSAPLTPAVARAVCRAAPVPVFALGGIRIARVRDALASGAHGIAVMSSVFAAKDPARALHNLLHELDDARSL